MIPVGQPYVAAGRLDARSILTTLILGIVAACLGAAAVRLWEISPIPAPSLLTPLILGPLIGLALGFVVGRLRMRNPKLLATIGLACGLASMCLVHYGHHLDFLTEVATRRRFEVKADEGLTPEEKGKILDRLAKDPEAAANAHLVAKTGHPGLIGSLILWYEDGSMRGWPLHIWVAEMIIVAGVAAAIASIRAARPFCEDCGDWCTKGDGRLSLPGEHANVLVEAVRGDDPAGLAAFRDRPAETAGGPARQAMTAGTTLYACPSCDQTFADVWQRTEDVWKGKVETTTKKRVRKLRVSPEMTRLLRAEPSPATTDLPAGGA